jgi:hypothetical protein
MSLRGSDVVAAKGQVLDPQIESIPPHDRILTAIGVEHSLVHSLSSDHQDADAASESSNVANVK